MLKRGSRRLKHGRCILDRVLPQNIRSKRALHSDFWSHGAADIDLPPWWVFSLQVSADQTTTFSPMTTRRDDVQRANWPSSSPFLEILYPSKTLNYMQNLVPYQQPFPGTSFFRTSKSNAIRTFASGPRDEQHTHTVNDDSMESSEEEGNDTGLGMPQMLPEEQEDGSIERREDWSIEGNDNFQDSETLASEENTLSDTEAEYADALASSEFLGILEDTCQENEVQAHEAIAKSPFEKVDALESEDNLRSRELFDQLPVQQRSAPHYRLSISCALNERDFVRALHLHQEAFSQDRGSILTSEILSETLIHQEWNTASTLLNDIMKRNDENVLQEIRKGLETIPYILLQRKTRRLDKYYREFLESQGWAASSPFRKLLQFLVFNCLSRPKRELHDAGLNITQCLIDVMVRLVKSTCSYPWQNVIEELLSLDLRPSDKKAMWLYSKMRSRVGIVPSKELLVSSMVRMRNRHWIYTMRLLEDYQRFYPEHPETAAKTLIHAFAHRGYIDIVLKLIVQCLRRSPGFMEPYQMEALIMAYMRRADIAKAVELFESLESFKFKPTPTCWHTLIKAHARVGDTKGAASCFERLCESDITPNSKTYEVMLGVHARRGDLVPIEKLLNQIRKRNVKITIAMLDYVVMAYVKRNEILAAEKLCRQFLYSNVEGSRLRMWNFVLLQAALKWSFQRTNRVFLEMQSHKIGCDNRTLGALMLALCNDHRPEQAHKIVSTVMPRLNIEPTTLHWSILMRGYLQVRKMRNAFMVYRTMLRKRTQPDFSTKVLLMKAASMSDVENLRQSSTQSIASSREPLVLPTADTMLATMIDDLSPTDISTAQPPVGVGPSQTIDEAAVSGAFQFLTYLYGSKGNSQKVDSLYESYEQTSKRFYPERPSTPSIRMLSSLMVDYRKTNYIEGMEQSWTLALRKAEDLSRRLSKGKPHKANWVLPQYQSILDLCLAQYILFLRDRSREAEISPILRKLRTQGYWLSSLNLNLYVQSLAASREPLQQVRAFSECEKRLMPGWQGWFSTTSVHVPPAELVRFKVKQQQPHFRGVNKTRAAPTYRTLVMLARLWLDLRARDQFGRAMGGTFMRQLGRSAPLTVEAIQGMPKMGDELQMRYLSEDV